MYSQILVPVDGSELAERALAHAEGLAKSGGATVHLLRVFTSHPESNPSGGGLETAQSVEATMELVRQLEEAQIGAAQEYLDHVADRLRGDGINVETELGQGAPDEVIVDYVKKNGIDIVTMSSHGRGGIRRMLLGSVTDRVIRSGTVPVLVVQC